VSLVTFATPPRSAQPFELPLHLPVAPQAWVRHFHIGSSLSLLSFVISPGHIGRHEFLIAAKLSQRIAAFWHGPNWHPFLVEHPRLRGFVWSPSHLFLATLFGITAPDLPSYG